MGSRNDQFRERVLPYLRGLQQHSWNQGKILRLEDKGADRTPEEDRDLAAAWKVERINARANKPRVEAYMKGRKQRLSERKARTRRLIELGALVELSGLEQDRGVVLGALLHLVDQLKTEKGQQALGALKRRGDQELQRRESERKARKKSPKASPEEPRKAAP